MKVKYYQLPDPADQQPAILAAWILLSHNNMQWPHISQLFQCTEEISWDGHLEPLLKSPLQRPLFIFDPDRLPTPVLQQLSGLVVKN